MLIGCCQLLKKRVIIAPIGLGSNREEARDCFEGTCSAASPAQIEKSSTSAIADQKIESSRPSAELMTENSVSSVEIKAVDEGENSAAPVSNADK